MFYTCLLRHGVLRVFVSFCVLVFVRTILSFCHGALKHIYIVYNILLLNISSIYINLTVLITFLLEDDRVV